MNAPLLNPAGRDLGRFNAVMGGRHLPIRGRPVEQATDFPGPLSLKLVLGGKATWRTRSGTYVVDQGCCLVLNRGQPYSLVFDDEEPLQTFCPFFEDGFFEGVARCLAEADEALLDAPFEPSPPAGVEEHVRPLDARLAAPIERLRRLAARPAIEPTAWEDAFHGLARALAAWRADLAAGPRLGSARASTRTEIGRRLSRAVDHIHAYAHDPIGLPEIAGAAALSPHHFHRLFSQSQGMTPHAYLTGLRLSRAARQLVATDRPVIDICQGVGFESLTTFTGLFGRRYGAPPAAWRRQFRKIEEAPPSQAD